MKITHVALWADDIESLKDFYVKYFEATAGPRYNNPVTGFSSYFLSFSDGGAELEIMNIRDIVDREATYRYKGFCHLALSLGSKAKVDEYTEYLRADGVAIIGNPRTTGDGFYESVICDPEGNIVELTV